jgi:uncharacterized protein
MALAWWGCLVVVGAVSWAAGPAFARTIPPAPSKFVTDLAGVIPDSREAALNTKLEAFERDTSNQVVVWVDKKLPAGWSLEEFAAEAFKKWGIGQKNRDNGVLLLVFTQTRQARIEVGYGLEGALPDAIANRILQEQAIPSFRKGDYAEGIGAAVDGIIAATRGEYKGTGGGAPQPSSGAPSWLGYLLLAGFIFGPGLIFGRASRRRGRTYGSSGWWIWPLLGGWGGGWGGGSSGDGGFSGGGFSGGGGMSGGGGASGSW